MDEPVGSIVVHLDGLPVDTGSQRRLEELSLCIWLLQLVVATPLNVWMLSAADRDVRDERAVHP